MSQQLKINMVMAMSCATILALVMLTSIQSTSEYWLAAIASVMIFTLGIIITVNRSLDGYTKKVADLTYDLKLSEQTIANLRNEITILNESDEMTGCANQHHFIEQVGRHIALHQRSGLQFSLLRIKVDNFPNILSQHGQRGTTEILKAFALILKGSIREVDITSRFEDEHFAVLLSDAGTAGALLVANRIVRLTDQLQTNNEHDKITLSIGVNEFQGGENAQRLIADAETAMEFASREGGDRVAGFNHTPSGPAEKLAS